MRYHHYGPWHEFRMFLQLFTHWPFLLCLFLAGVGGFWALRRFRER